MQKQIASASSLLQLGYLYLATTLLCLIKEERIVFSAIIKVESYSIIALLALGLR